MAFNLKIDTKSVLLNDRQKFAHLQPDFKKITRGSAAVKNKPDELPVFRKLAGLSVS
jgi:hypothetical protein